MDAVYATIIAVLVFTFILERYIRFVTPGYARFLGELSLNAFLHGGTLTLVGIVLFCWHLWRAIFSFADRMSDAIDRFGEELMPDMTFTPTTPWKGSKLTK